MQLTKQNLQTGTTKQRPHEIQEHGPNPGGYAWGPSYHEEVNFLSILKKVQYNDNQENWKHFIAAVGISVDLICL